MQRLPSGVGHSGSTSLRQPPHRRDADGRYAARPAAHHDPRTPREHPVIAVDDIAGDSHSLLDQRAVQYAGQGFRLRAGQHLAELRGGVRTQHTAGSHGRHLTRHDRAASPWREPGLRRLRRTRSHRTHADRTMQSGDDAEAGSCSAPNGCEPGRRVRLLCMANRPNGWASTVAADRAIRGR
jgi:hypothetical protein